MPAEGDGGVRRGGRRGFRLAILLAAVIVFGCVGFRVYRHFVPWGVQLGDWQAFNFASVDQGWRSSPAESNRVHVVVNDAGAAHSGRCHAWILAPNLLLGDRVVAAGYVEDSRTPVAIEWSDESTFEVGFFRHKRDSPEEVTHTVSLD